MKYYAVRKGKHPRIIAGEWKAVEPEVRKEISGFPNPEWKGFKTREEAEAYMAQGNAAKPRKAVSGWRASNTRMETRDPEDEMASEFRFTADAVIFVDGSRNFDNVDFDGAKPHRRLSKNKNFYFGSYGILIFFRGGSVYVESARIEDGDANGNAFITASHHSFAVGADGTAGEVLHETEKVAYTQRCHKTTDIEFDDQYVLASWNIAGEVGGVQRALDICFHRKNLGSAYVFFDCDQVDIVRKIQRGGNPALSTNVTADYGEFCRKIMQENKHVGTMHVYSHSKGQKKGIRYDDRLELFNSCADVLAKAETYNKPIDPVVENRPLAPYGLVPFARELAYSDSLGEGEIAQVADVRRAQAFELIKNVLADSEVRPNFV
jgi:hypothetical protein